MNFGEWQAKLYDNPNAISVDLYLYRNTSGRREMLTHEGKVVTIKEGSATDYNNYFARFEGNDQLRVVAEAFANFGVKTSTDAKNEGLLEATKAHLEDMRNLVFSHPVTPQEESK